MLMNYHIGRLVLSSLCVEALLRLVFGGVRFAGFVLFSVRCVLELLLRLVFGGVRFAG